ncbi:MAG: hypothetical protein XU08_C0003G0111 [candidate division WWE3 bacterium CSP1-7]|uniref:Uncharacterized protein n=1 Tax=candidate division WWE3 bacterium CSP1-7 TaxID=1576480 RepID=A0A0T5ZXD5_UNCKA|nr:MAG: hypothetical protein XU08_C0003G0111 [candidate division WWE3 bacterium CSP1-7]
MEAADSRRKEGVTRVEPQAVEMKISPLFYGHKKELCDKRHSPFEF